MLDAPAHPPREPAPEEPTEPAGRRPVVVYDGEAGVYRRWAARWKERTGDRIDYLTIDDAAPKFPDLSVDQLRQAVHLIAPDGEVTSGAPAIYRALASAPGSGAAHFAYQRFPGFAVVADAFHRFVAAHRHGVSRVVAVLDGRDERAPTYDLSRFVFFRALGVVALAAFVSLWVQIDGLLGSSGIAPAAGVLERVARRAADEGHPLERFHRVPSLFWMSPTDGMLQALCAAGVIASLLLIVDVLPAFALVSTWLLYLSLVSIGSVFFHFQWDALLLETCLISLFFVPIRAWPRVHDVRAPSRLGVLMLRLLCFKLMLLSGAVKLMSKDRTWTDLTALDYHYFTQPLPSFISWWAQKLPASIQKTSVVVMFVVELVLPFFIFGPRRARYLAFAGFALLQVLIFLTGNYGFFNLLTLAIAIPLLDDSALRPLFPSRVRARASAATRSRWPSRLLRALSATPILIVSATWMAAAFMKNPAEDLPETALDLAVWASPFDSINGYGLFRSMTTERPEIVIEGSDDGMTWKPYEFRYKPGDPSARPKVVGLHMPRLDWQMWFAALRQECRNTEWYPQLVHRLLAGSKPVRALLSNDPFPDRPPTFVRSTLWLYEFTSRQDRAATGAWWRRKKVRPYCPTLTLQDGALIAVELEE